MSVNSRFAFYPKNSVIPFEGIRNFRDMGGYETTDGRKVKHGLFFRSAALAGITDNDREFFETLGIKYIFDYRSNSEASSKPNPGFDGIIYERFPAIPEEKHAPVRSMEDLARDELVKQLNERELNQLYQSLVLNNPSYKRLMEVIQEPDNLAIVHHCAVGKDRTGVGAALILLALDVPRETVIKDYLLSNEHLKILVGTVRDKITGKLTKEEIAMVDAMMAAKREYLEGAFKTIEETYADFDTFFEEEFGLTPRRRAKLKDYCLV